MDRLSLRLCDLLSLSPPLPLPAYLPLIPFPFFSIAKDWTQDVLHGRQALDHTLNSLWTFFVAFIEEDLELLAPDPITERSDRGKVPKALVAAINLQAVWPFPGVAKTLVVMIMLSTGGKTSTLNLHMMAA